jgi:Phosphopantetheine attachment site
MSELFADNHRCPEEEDPLSIHSAHPAEPKTGPGTVHAVHSPVTGDELLGTLLELAYEVLGIRCDRDENFFDYGDSMAAVQLCALTARRHGWTITPRDVFAWQSFAQLAGVVERDEAERRTIAATPRGRARDDLSIVT